MKNTILLFSIFLIQSCIVNNPDGPEEPMEPTLPELTITGLHTFGCIVNGELWIPNVDAPFSSLHYELNYDDSNGGFNLNAGRINNSQNIDEIIFIKSTILDTGIYHINSPPGDDIVFMDFELGGVDCVEFKSHWEKETHIEIVYLDKAERIISGRFEYLAHNLCGDTLEITDGRFDLKYL